MSIRKVSHSAVLPPVSPSSHRVVITPANICHSSYQCQREILLRGVRIWAKLEPSDHVQGEIEALPETVSREDVLKLLHECAPEEPIEAIARKPVTLIQMLAEMDANPDDPRVVRLFELSVKTCEHTLTEEERIERFKILEALVQEARAKGKDV